MTDSPLMTELRWKEVQYMHHSKENWGDPYKVHEALVFNLENMRVFSGEPCVLTCPAYDTDGHTPDSYHYKGMAADFRFLKLNLMEMYLLTERFNFSGIGLYPPIVGYKDKDEIYIKDDRPNGRKPFIHADVRPFDPLSVQNRWIGFNVVEVEGGKEKRSMHYVPFTIENYNLYCKNY